MTLLFVDGFDHYATNDLSKKYNIVSGGCQILATGRRSGSAFGDDYASALFQVTKTLAASASFVIGFAFIISPMLAAARNICQLADAGTVQCALQLNADGTLSVVRSTGTALTGGTSSFALSGGTYYYIEWKVTIADSIGANTCKVRVNGVECINVTTGQDVKSTANATANQVVIGLNGGATGCSCYWDDFYICDQSGATNNDFLGDVRVDTIFPTSDGNYSQFTPSTGSTHYTLMDEAAPNTTDYNDGSTVGHRDSYGMGNLAALASQTVYGVQVNAAILKDDAGAKSASTMVRSGSTDADGASAALGTSQVYISQVYEQDPAATAAWTETTVNSMEAGVKVTA